MGFFDQLFGGKRTKPASAKDGKVLAVLAPPALLMVLGSFLPWVWSEGKASYAREHGSRLDWDGFNTVVMTEYDRDGHPRAELGDMGITLLPGVTVSAGALVLICCTCTILVAAFRRPRWATAFGAAGIGLGACMFLRISGDVITATEYGVSAGVGPGIWVVLAGAVFVTLGGVFVPRIDSAKEGSNRSRHPT